MKRGRFRSFTHRRETFPSADLVGKLTVFNIGSAKCASSPPFTTTAERSIFAPSSVTANTTPKLGRNDRHPQSDTRSLARTLAVRLRPHTEMEYRRLVALLDQLVDEVGNDESHPLASLMEVIGLLIEKYEDEQVPVLKESTVVREEPPTS
ncbi:MAG TPA: hypothetical protein VGI60_03530 [Chthoniobacterales bacterium]|jgi:HTH-type transcriptional regulator/antitoxin HigA